MHGPASGHTSSTPPPPRPQEQYFDTLAKSTTLYIGNLSFFTTEEQIHELFSRAGDVKRIIMGLDAVKKTPCGFCFVLYYARKYVETTLAACRGCMACHVMQVSQAAGQARVL